MMEEKASFVIASDLKEKIGELYRPQVLELAAISGHTEAYNALINNPNRLQVASELLGTEKELKEYLTLANTYIEEKNEFPKELFLEFHRFLMAKICFPDEV